MNLKQNLTYKAAALSRYLWSRRGLAIFKGALAYVLGFVLVFLRDFDKLSKYPTTLTSMTVILLVGGAGKAVGTCIQSLALALCGVCCGAVCFVILAELSGSQVAQGFAFAAIVYVFALIKAKGPKWLPFALLAIVMSFNGIYTSLLVGGFSATYLQEYLKSYCWAAAIVLAVNILILPKTSEKELRQTLILSLEHIATFSHLLSKGYTLEITEEERIVREHLAQTIRADFQFLLQKIEETAIEINYSKFSMSDYHCFVNRTRGMQLALITAYSSLVNVEKRDTELFKTEFLPNTIKSFTHFRAALNTTMKEISLELGCKALDIPATSAGYAEFMDLERQHSSDTLSLDRQVTTSTTGGDSVGERLNSVSRRLAEEYGEEDIPDSAVATFDEAVMTPRVPDTLRSTTEVGTPSHAQDLHINLHALPTERKTENAAAALHGRSQTKSPGFCIRCLRRVYDRFSADQHDILVKCLIKGNLHGADDSLRIGDPLPSLRDMYQYRYVPSTNDNSENSPVRMRRRRRAWMDSEDGESGSITPIITRNERSESKGDEYYELIREKSELERWSDKIATSSHHSLTRVYSFLFAMEQFVTELEILYFSSRKSPKRRLHVHLFERLGASNRQPQFPVPATGPFDPSSLTAMPQQDTSEDSSRDLSVAEALALLEHRPYTKEKPNVWQRLEKVELWFRGPTSVYAAKTAAAATIYAILILHPVPRPWFISFGMTSGTLTIATALTPTLGQSILGFILQIAGSGVGYIWALILLEIFRNVGGYHFNPFGIIVLLFPYAMVLTYILYENPQYFVAAFLGMNGTSGVLMLEWIMVEYTGKINYDTPILRFGKAFTTLGIALALSATFQLFILRNPARRTLRKRMGAMMYSQLSYVTLLQAFARGAMPTDPSRRAPDAALKRVEEELRHRELKIQTELISLRPLIGFAAAEPQFTRPFRADVIVKLLRTSQIILDRMRESRTAISSRPLPDFVIKNFIRILSPYRRRNQQVLQLGFYIIASSILAKSPLLREAPVELDSATHRGNFMHDILVLSSRVAKTEEGARAIRSGDFTRYFHYVVGITSLNEHLHNLEDCCRDLFGELEGHLA